MGILDTILSNLPEVAGPQQRRLSFKEKMKWTGITLVLFFVLGLLPLFGLGPNELSRFQYLSIILGAKFGSLISLGIGPIVTASIVLQLLNGSGIINMDLATQEGKRRFQGIQKLLAVFFIVFEACIYVLMGGLNPITGVANFKMMQFLLIFQLCIGGLLIMFMDEVISKWGFGSGLSLFIAAGVSETIFIRLLSPYTNSGILGWPFASGAPVGKILELFYALSAGDPTTAGLAFATITATVLVFLVAVYAQSMKIEIPLSFGRIRGHGIRWPLNFLYTSNIPVILIAALIANVQLWARLLQNWGFPILGTFVGQSPATGIVSWIYAPSIVNKFFTGSLAFTDVLHSLSYALFMVGGAIIFSIFWVQTSGMDARSQAKQIMSSGLQIPGFRKDQRVLERLLDRYIWPLTVMGGIAVGVLAAVADLSDALGTGTGILLAVMIIYKLYEEIAKQHMMDMHPMMRKMME